MRLAAVRQHLIGHFRNSIRVKLFESVQSIYRRHRPDHFGISLIRIYTQTNHSENIIRPIDAPFLHRPQISAFFLRSQQILRTCKL